MVLPILAPVVAVVKPVAAVATKAVTAAVKVASKVATSVAKGVSTMAKSVGNSVANVAPSVGRSATQAVSKAPTQALSKAPVQGASKMMSAAPKQVSSPIKLEPGKGMFKDFNPDKGMSDQQFAKSLKKFLSDKVNEDNQDEWFSLMKRINKQGAESERPTFSKMMKAVAKETIGVLEKTYDEATETQSPSIKESVEGLNKGKGGKGLEPEKKYRGFTREEMDEERLTDSRW